MTPEGSWFCISACSNAIRHHLAGTPSAALCWVMEPVGTLDLQGLRALAALSLLQSSALQSQNTAVQHWEPLKPRETRESFSWNTQYPSIYDNPAKIKLFFTILPNTASPPISNPLTGMTSSTSARNSSLQKSDRSTINFICLQKNLQWVCLCTYKSVLGVFQKRSRTGQAIKY